MQGNHILNNNHYSYHIDNVFYHIISIQLSELMKSDSISGDVYLITDILEKIMNCSL